MSILRAKTQMLKQRERLHDKITDNADKRKQLDKVDDALEAQIQAIDAALATLENAGGV